MNILYIKIATLILQFNGNVINRFKTLKENGIKDGNTIIANIYDE